MSGQVLAQERADIVNAAEVERLRGDADRTLWLQGLGYGLGGAAIIGALLMVVTHGDAEATSAAAPAELHFEPWPGGSGASLAVEW